MHIRHILPEPELGVLPHNPLDKPLTGVTNGVFQLARVQAARGHDVEIICPSDEGLTSQKVIANVKIRWLQLWDRFRLPRYDFRYLLPLMRYTIGAKAADITHIHDNPYLLALFRSRASIVHHHGPILKGSPMYDRMESRADRVLCISHFVRSEFLNKVQYLPEKVITLYDGLHPDEFVTETRETMRQRYGIPDHAVVILYAGRIVPEKGLLVLLHALRSMDKPDFPPLVLCIAGSTRLGLGQAVDLEKSHPDLSHYEREVATAIEALAQVCTIHRLGNLETSAMGAFYSMGDIFVCPSIWQEPFGRINIEAMAAGLPVIASAVGGIPEIIEHGKTGLLVPPNDPHALAVALDQLINAFDMRQELSQGARRLAGQFDWAIIAQQLDSIYTEILTSG